MNRTKIFYILSACCYQTIEIKAEKKDFAI